MFCVRRVQDASFQSSVSNRNQEALKFVFFVISGIFSFTLIGARYDARSRKVEYFHAAIGSDPYAIQGKHRRQSTILLCGTNFIYQVQQPETHLTPRLTLAEQIQQRLTRDGFERVPILLV